MTEPGLEPREDDSSSSLWTWKPHRLPLPTVSWNRPSLSSQVPEIPARASASWLHSELKHFFPRSGLHGLEGTCCPTAFSLLADYLSFLPPSSGRVASRSLTTLRSFLWTYLDLYLYLLEFVCLCACGVRACTWGGGGCTCSRDVKTQPSAMWLLCFSITRIRGLMAPM